MKNHELAALLLLNPDQEAYAHDMEWGPDLVNKLVNTYRIRQFEIVDGKIVDFESFEFVDPPRIQEMTEDVAKWATRNLKEEFDSMMDEDPTFTWTGGFPAYESMYQNSHLQQVEKLRRCKDESQIVTVIW